MSRLTSSSADAVTGPVTDEAPIAAQEVVLAGEPRRRIPGEDWIITDPTLIDRMLVRLIVRHPAGTIVGQGLPDSARIVLLKCHGGRLSVAPLSLLAAQMTRPGAPLELSFPAIFGEIRFAVLDCVVESQTQLSLAKPGRLAMIRRRNLDANALSRQVRLALGSFQETASSSLLALV